MCACACACVCVCVCVCMCVCVWSGVVGEGDLALKYNLYTRNKVVICISDRCVDSIAKLKWKEIKVSSAANETKMLELI